MATIDALQNIDALLGMTQYLDKMKPKSIIYLFNKLCELENTNKAMGIEIKIKLKEKEKF